MMKHLGIVGGGNMGEALLAGILRKRLFAKRQLLVSESLSTRRRYLKKQYAITVTQDNKTLIQKSDIVILAVKPQQMEGVLREVTPFKRRVFVISIAAGVRLSLIERYWGRLPMVRVMPNLAAAVGEAVSVLSKGRYAQKAQCRMAEKIFRSVGEVLWSPEAQLDHVTAVSGSGPAYVAYFLSLLQDSAEKLGLSKSMSKQLVQKTFEGSLSYLSQKKVDPKQFIQKVASKGGTTEAALKVFHRRQLSQTITLALRQASLRSKQLSRG